MAGEAEKLLKDYQKIQKDYASKLKTAEKSKTYYSSSNVAPTKEDIKKAVELQKIKAKAKDAISEYQNVRWYGTDEETEKKKALWEKLSPGEKTKESLVSKGLNVLSTGIYAGVGAAETALGKGSKRGLWENIQANVKERETYGDLIRKYGITNWVAAPVGFILDVALDPLNWATMGTGALVPRIATGAYKGLTTGKGLLAGAGLAAKSGLLSKASKAMKYTPLVKETLTSEKLARKASRSMDWYDELVDNTDITKQLPMTNVVKGLTNKFSDYLEGREWGRELKRAGRYSPTEPIKEAQRVEEGLESIPLARTPEEAQDMLRAQSRRGLFSKVTKHEYREPMDMLEGELTKAANIADDSSGMFTAGSAAERQRRLEYEAANNNEVSRMMQRILEIAQDKTGIRIVDENKEKIGRWMEDNYPRLKKVLTDILNGYKVGIGNFKIGKVALSPAAYTNSIIGNWVMTKMAGIDMSPELQKNIRDAFKMVNGVRVDPEFLSKIIGNDEVAAWIQKYPRTFAMAFGVSPEILTNRRAILEKIRQSKDTGTYKKIMDIIETSDKEAASILRPYGAGKWAADRSGNAANIFLPTTYSADVLAGMADVQRRLIARLDAVDTPVAKQLAQTYKAFLTKPMAFYESIDQAHKIGIFTHLTSNGITRKELDLLKKILNLENVGDVTRVKGYDLYKLSPQKAAEASQEIYMNYRAMPGVVKLLRNAPILGAPFISFMYGMLAKTGKTAAYNPSFFSKMQALMQEVSGGQNPLERENLNNMYNSYLAQPGMVHLPIFGQNPVYMRVEQMLPYYSLNMFQQGDRDLDDPRARLIAEVTDKVGIMSDPVGQMILNYFILPPLLKDEAPKGMFGNQLLPSDAKAWQKYAAYPIRDVLESQVPQVITPLGTVAGLATPSSLAPWEEYFPSFRWRQFARAARGETTVGKETTTPGKWWRALAGWMGLPLYTTEIRTQQFEPSKKEQEAEATNVTK